MHLNFNIKHFYSVSAFPFPSSQKLKTESSTFRHLKEMRNSHQLRLHPDCRQHPLLGQGAAAICRLFAYSSLSLSLSLVTPYLQPPWGKRKRKPPQIHFGPGKKSVHLSHPGTAGRCNRAADDDDYGWGSFFLVLPGINLL